MNGEDISMDLDLIMDIIEKNGYLGLFLWLWFGVFGLPVPNEVISMTVGLAASLGALHPVSAFVVTYCGILAALTTLYLLGRLVGRRLISTLEKRKRFSNTLKKSLRLLERYHALSLSFSYFIPGVRNFLPLLYGFSRLPYRSFALFAYSGAFIWLLVVFSIGYLFGDNVEVVGKYGEELAVCASLTALVLITARLVRKKKGSRMKALDR